MLIQSANLLKDILIELFWFQQKSILRLKVKSNNRTATTFCTFKTIKLKLVLSLLEDLGCFVV